MKEKEEQKFESLLEIDKRRLDDECVDQPYRVWDYGRMFAKAILAVDEATAELKLVEADVEAAARDDPGFFGLEISTRTGQPTEPAIKRAIIRSKEYKEAIKTLHEATYRVNMLSAANKALDHRRTSLSMLDGQDTRGYFSRPKQQQRVDSGRSKHRKPLRKRRK
jgi:hypothetical protein